MRNRAGNPDAVVRLSERELETWGPPTRARSRCSISGSAGKRRPAPRGAPGSTAPGSRPLASRPPRTDDTAAAEHRPGTRLGYAVLELAGRAWSAGRRRIGEGDVGCPSGAGVEGAERTVRRGSPRLMAVDIGRDPQALRQQYPERSQYLILPATYRAVHAGDRDSSARSPCRLARRGASRSCCPERCMCRGRCATHSSDSAPHAPIRPGISK